MRGSTMVFVNPPLLKTSKCFTLLARFKKTTANTSQELSFKDDLKAPATALFFELVVGNVDDNILEMVYK